MERRQLEWAGPNQTARKSEKTTLPSRPTLRPCLNPAPTSSPPTRNLRWISPPNSLGSEPQPPKCKIQGQKPPQRTKMHEPTLQQQSHNPFIFIVFGHYACLNFLNSDNVLKFFLTPLKRPCSVTFTILSKRKIVFPIAIAFRRKWRYGPHLRRGTKISGGTHARRDRQRQTHSPLNLRTGFASSSSKERQRYHGQSNLPTQDNFTFHLFVLP